MTCFLLSISINATQPALAAESPSKYPSKPVRVIVPFSPGGGVDIIARLIGGEISEALKQPFVIDNRTGAGGTIGVGIAARATSDGYTLVLTSNSLVFNEALYKTLSYDTVKDLAPISLVAISANILVTNLSLPVRTVQELIQYAKKRPGELAYGSGGRGSAAHICAEYFLRAAGIKVRHIPYKGMPLALVDLMAGRIAFATSSMGPAQALAKAGKLRVLGITTSTRSSIMPDVPTIAESGLPGFDYKTWYGLLAPAGTPSQVITKLNEEIRKLQKQATVRERMMAAGSEVAWNTASDYSSFIKAEIAKWTPMIKSF